MNNKRALIFSSLKVIYIGPGLFPKRIAGDKNFILDLSSCLSAKGVDVQLVSISEPDPSINNSQDELNNNFKIHFIPRAFHFRLHQYHWYGKQGELIGYHHSHSALRDFLELTPTILFAKKYLRSLLSPECYTIVHWVDLSLVFPLLRLAFGKHVRYVSSLLRYVPQGTFADMVRGRALSHADAVVTGTTATKNMLIEKGCSCSLIEPLSWGSPDNYRKNQSIYRKKFLKSKRTKLLWAGFIQQISKVDFFKAYNVAKNVTNVRNDVEFTFAFKPESFKEMYSDLSTPYIRIKKGDDTFIQNLKEYDAFFSPIIRMDSSLAPPLTWIEALGAGLPIITTRSLGIEEIISHKVSGMIFESWDTMVQWLRHANLKETLGPMHIEARKQFLLKFDIEQVCRRYLKLYIKVWSDGATRF